MKSVIALFVLVSSCFLVLLAGCSSGSSTDPPPSTPPAQQPASPPPTNPPPGTPTTPAPAPTVNAGPDQTLKLGTTVALSGSSTTTEQHPTYLWQFISLPQGSGAALKDPTTLTPTFTPDLTGLYVVRLTLDGTASDDVIIAVEANLLTLHFHGIYGPDGVADGSFTYEITQGPNATNVRSLQPNVLYRLAAWNIVLNSGQTVENFGLPSTVFDSSQPGNSSEFCEGKCIFDSTPYAELRFHNATPFTLQLLFTHQDPTPSINPPGSLAEWGPFRQGIYGVLSIGPIALFSSATLTEAP